MALQGLTVGADYTLRLNGNRFRNVGANWPSGFLPFVQSSPSVVTYTPDANVDAEIAAMVSMGIKIARVIILPFFPATFKVGVLNNVAWGSSTAADREPYYLKLDAFIAKCRAAGIGLILNFFWRIATVPDIVGANVRSWLSAGNTRTFATTLTQEIVTRYLTEQAVYGYEFGNETNNQLNTPNVNKFAVNVSYGTAASYSVANDTFVTSGGSYGASDVQNLLSWWYGVVRAIDSSRIVLGGNGSNTYWNESKTPTVPTPFTRWIAEYVRDNPTNVSGIHFYGGIGYCDNVYNGLESLATAAKYASKVVGKAFIFEEIGNQIPYSSSFTASGGVATMQIDAASDALFTKSGDTVLLCGTGTAWDGPANVVSVTNSNRTVVVSGKGPDVTLSSTYYVNPNYARFGRMLDQIFSADVDVVMVWQMTTQASEVAFQPYSSIAPGYGADFMIPIITAKNAQLAVG